MQQGFSPAEKPTMEQGCATAETIITVQELLEREAYLSVHHYPPVLDAGNVGERKLPCWTNPTSEPTGLSCSLLGSTSSASVNNLNRGAENVSPTGSAGQQMVGLKTENSRLRGSLLCFSEITYFLHGWIQLWNDSPHEANSLAFSDVSGTIPCALTEFDPEILGHPVRLISWSFIFLRKSEGFLEVRQLSMLEISQYLPRRPIFICPEAADVPNLVLETPPSKQKFKSPRHSIAGQVRFISPPFAVPQGECRSKHAGSQTPSLTTKNHLRDLTNCYKKTRVSVHGVSASRSFKVGRGSRVSQGKPLLGFFIGLSPCTHKPSCSIPKMDSSDILENIVDHEDEERYKQLTFYVYFSGSIVAWRPLLLATSGKCVCLTRLRKKVLVANEIGMRYSIYAATRISSIARCTSSSAENTEMGEIGCILHVKLSNFTKDVNQRGNQHLWQQNQVGSYIGIVTEIFLKGGLLELDGHVWVLLTHQPLSHIHGLRVGARVVANHVHFLRLTSPLEKGLLLAACSISHLVVSQFSPLQTLYAQKEKPDCCLNRFISSLPFLSAFWSLQVIASFRKKFQSFYKEKELLGSSRNMGIAGMYLQDLLSAENIYHRNIFGEFFSHSSSCSLAKHVPFNISMQVPPIRNFCKHIQLMWLDPYSILWSCQSITKGFEIAKGSSGMIRRVLRSDSLGVSVLGFLRFSSVTGRLQLFDATGAIDVVIPDLQTAQCPQGACQVTTYELVIEGHAESLGNQIKDQRFLPLSWYSLLKGISVKMEASKNVSFYMIFMLKEAHGLTYIRQPYFGFFPERECEMQLSSLIPKDANKESCNFDVLFVTHKYPVRLKQLCKSTGQGSLSFCVEVVRLPYTIKIFHGCRGQLGNNDAGGGQGSVACAISVLSLKDFFNMSGKVTDSVNGIRGYKRYNSLLSLIKCGSKAERLFVQFSDAQPTAFQIIQIGELYLSKSSQGSRWTNLISGSTFWSLKINHDFCGPIEANNVHMVYTSEYESNFPLVDAILRVPPSLEFELGFSLSDAKSILSPILSISQAMNSGKSVVHTEHMPETGMSKGCMVSLCGIVGTVDAEILFPSSSTEGHGLCCQKTFALKDMNHSHSIMVYCNSQVYFPVGFASGAVVAIHKALLKVSPDGEVSIECICSTLIHVCCAGSDSTLWKCETHVDQDYCKIEKQNCITLDLVTQIDAANSFVPKPFKISCRVVSVQRLILETTEATRRYLKSVETAIYTVRHVSLTLDDGSALATCVAQGKVAAGLLNLPFRSTWRSSWSEMDGMHLIGQLNAMINKYKLVLFQCADVQLDPSKIKFMFQGAQGQPLDVSDRKLLYSIVQRACHAGPLDVVAELQLHRSAHSHFWGKQSRNLQKSLQVEMPYIVAKMVGVKRYETEMSTVCKDIEDSLGKGMV